MKEIDVIQKLGHYEVYVDGKFKCSCDNFSEVREELAEIEK